MGNFSSKPKNQDLNIFKDLSDNKVFKNLQVVEIEKITNDDTVFVWDMDGVPFKEASKVEDDYIIVKHLETEEEWELSNVTEFRGRGAKVSDNSWLGVENLKRTANQEESWILEDFEVTKHKRLKKGKGIQDVIDYMENYIKMVKDQWGVKNFLFVLGKGECFRNDLPLPVPYKDRNDPRPLLLTEAREYLLAKENCIEAEQGFETDDVVEWYAFKGYDSYKRTGIFSHVMISEDKGFWR